MKTFKSKEAQELFDEANRLEEYANKFFDGDSNYYCELMTTAAGLRIQADEIEEENNN